MDPRLGEEKYGAIDANVSGNTNDPLGSCAETWARYQASFSIFQDLFFWSSRMLSQEQDENVSYKQTQIHGYDYKSLHRTAFNEEPTNSGISASLEVKISDDPQQNHFDQVSREFYGNQSLNPTASSLHLDQYDAPFQLEALNEEWQLYLTILYTLTAITSFLLNVVTVIVLSRGQRSELKKYLINLSVGDLLMSCFSIPFTYTEYMLGRWMFASFLCPLVRLVVTLSVFVSVVTMTVIGINR